MRARARSRSASTSAATTFGLGTPFNLTEGAALLHLVGRLTGFKPKWFSYFIGDAHIYENHLPMLQEQLAREPLPAPKLVLSDRIPDYARPASTSPDGSNWSSRATSAWRATATTCR